MTLIVEAETETNESVEEVVEEAGDGTATDGTETVTDTDGTATGTTGVTVATDDTGVAEDEEEENGHVINGGEEEECFSVEDIELLCPSVDEEKDYSIRVEKIEITDLNQNTITYKIYVRPVMPLKIEILKGGTGVKIEILESTEEHSVFNVVASNTVTELEFEINGDKKILNMKLPVLNLNSDNVVGSADFREFIKMFAGILGPLQVIADVVGELTSLTQ